METNYHHAVPFIEVNPGHLNQMINKSGLTVVQFHSPSCAPCHALKPWLVEQAYDHSGVTFLGLDAMADTDTAINQKVRSFPTVLVFNEGTELARIVGAAAVREKLPTILKEHTSFSLISMENF
jgi:thioredoxin 1